LDGAIADYSKAIELDPKDASAWFARSLARKAKGDQVGADADLAQAGKVQGR
jgi:Flp pilus assembly protein TadD